MALKKYDDWMKLDPEIFSFFMDGMLLTAGTKEDCNTMAVGWGGLGSLWSRPVATIYVRPTRHTLGFLEKEDYFSLSVLPKEMDDKVNYCGMVSGRDEDKFAAMNIQWKDAEYVNAPILTDCPVSIECSVIESTQPGTHELFIGKVEAVHADEQYLDANGNILWNKIDLM